MAARYEVHVRDTAGVLTGVVAEWVSLAYTKRINAVGEFQLVVDQTNPNLAALGILDAQVEVRREDLAANPVIDQYTDFGGFKRDEAYETSDLDDDTYRVRGVSYEDLLARKLVAYPGGSAGAAKTGPGETVMKAYVNENGGPLSTPANGRQILGVFPGLTIQADGAAGAAWTGDRAGRRLLDVLRDISDATDVDFEVANTGAATWEFRAKAEPIGVNRTVVGLVPATGLNGAGNPPVIFSLGRANMGAPSFSTSRIGEKNIAIVQGQGIGEDRVVVTIPGAGQNDSPWNAIEVNINANEEDDAAGWTAAANAKLEELQAIENFRFSVLQQPGTLYGRDYFVGDLVTARYLTFERSIKIAAITVEVAGGIESITAELQNVT